MDGTRAATDRQRESEARRGIVAPRPVFDRIVCGMDGTGEALAAAREARSIAPGVAVTLVHVIDVLDAVQHRGDYPAWLHARRAAGQELLDAARHRLESEGFGPAEVAIEEGDIAEALRYSAATGGRPLIAIGSGDETDLVLRSSGPPPTGARLSSRIVEAVPCSVLVSRSPTWTGPFPESITVGVDGSAPSLYAYRVAERIAGDSGAELVAVVALGGKGADLQALHDAGPAIPVNAITEDKPVKALLDACAHSDLIVVGNRGLHGLWALGSVSRRVVAGSPSSVLVVRAPTPDAGTPAEPGRG